MVEEIMESLRSVNEKLDLALKCKGIETEIGVDLCFELERIKYSTVKSYESISELYENYMR